MASLFRVTIKEAAIEELDRIYQLAAKDKPVSAKKFINKIKHKITSLSKFPKRGSTCKLPALTQLEIRFLVVEHYMIFYTIKERTVDILHITSPGKDWMDLLM